MGGSGDSGDVVHEQPGIGRRFDPDELRPRRQGCRKDPRVCNVDLVNDAAERLEDPGEEAVSAAVDVQGDDDLVTWLQPRLQHRRLGGEARGENRCVCHAFERREHLLEPCARRVVRSRVVEALMNAGLILLVSRRLKDWRDERTGARLRRLRRVNRACSELHVCSFSLTLKNRMGDVRLAFTGNRTHDYWNRVLLRRPQRCALDELASIVGHRQRSAVGDGRNVVRVRMAIGIGREVARDILDELAPAGAEAGGQEDGCQNPNRRGRATSRRRPRREPEIPGTTTTACDASSAKMRSGRKRACPGAPAPSGSVSPVWCTLMPVARTPRDCRASARSATALSSPVDHKRSTIRGSGVLHMPRAISSSASVTPCSAETTTTSFAPGSSARRWSTNSAARA